MAYDQFTKQIVFKDQNVNVICNRIYEALINKFTANKIDTEFCITGTVAKIIQGQSLTDITAIPFITDSITIFKYCGNELAKLLGATAVNLKDRVQMNYKGIYFEFWLTGAIGTINTVTDLKVQNTADIPPNIS